MSYGPIGKASLYAMNGRATSVEAMKLYIVRNVAEDNLSANVAQSRRNLTSVSNVYDA